MTSNDAAKDFKGRKFVITREYQAQRELVFRAWTDPKQLVQWWGPDGFTNPVCEWDPKPGKSIYVVMRGPDGTDFPMGGTFSEVVAPERLVFSCGAMDGNRKLLFEFLHTVSFTEAKGRTTVTVKSVVTMTTPNVGMYIGGYEPGMTQSLDRLALLVE
jgi:uncharacterized protein YndB with AHSA1/START domain